MISKEAWSEFMFAYWKFIKKYLSNEVDNFEACIKDADALMKEYPQNIFHGMVFAFLEQKSYEAIRTQKTTPEEIERMNSAQFPLTK